METSYWNHRGTHQALADKLNELIPASGACENARGKNKNLDKFRRASNVYYDAFNNGLCNRRSSFRGIFGFSAADYTRWAISNNRPYKTINFDRIAGPMDLVMDKIILDAAEEQGLL